MKWRKREEGPHESDCGKYRVYRMGRDRDADGNPVWVWDHYAGRGGLEFGGSAPSLIIAKASAEGHHYG